MECVGESRSVLSTLDKLKRVELKMELLTRELEQMPAEKVTIAQKVCGIFENLAGISKPYKWFQTRFLVLQTGVSTICQFFKPKHKLNRTDLINVNELWCKPPRSPCS